MQSWIIVAALALAPVAGAAPADPPRQGVFLGITNVDAHPAAAEPTLEARAAAAGKIAAALDALAGQPAPADLKGDDLVVWKSQGDWLRRTAGRIRAIVTTAQAAGDPAAKMAQMNMQFLELQNAMQNESRKFNTLSTASVRSTSAITEMKGLVTP